MKNSSKTSILNHKTQPKNKFMSYDEAVDILPIVPSFFF